MSILGLTTKRELEAQVAAAVEQALKAATPKYPAWALETAAAERFNIPDPSIYENQADLYRKMSWVLTAVELTAQSAALTPFAVARIINGKEPKDIPGHPFEQLLNKPNPLDSRFEFLFATVAFWKLTGNGYWWMNKSSRDAPPDELWFIPSHMIQPVPDGRMYLKGYLYYPGDGQELALEPWEIVHFRRPNPFSRFVGLSAIEALATVAVGDLKMAEWNTKLFAENNARLPGILSFKDMVQDDTWEKIKDETRNAARKREMLMLRGAGDQVTWLQNAVSQKEMEFLSGRKANKEEIWSVLAPGLMSMLSENATEANSRTGRAVFNELTVYPMHVMMGEKITSQILPTYSGTGRPLLGHFEDIRVTDRQLELQEQAEFSKVHTIAEIREEYYGDEPLGDERDKLLPEQIKAESGGIQEPPPPPVAPGQQPGMKPDQAQVTEQQKPEEPPAPAGDETAKAALELDAWERRALNRGAGKALGFKSDILSPAIMSDVQTELAAAKSQSDIRGIFRRARAQLKQEPKGEAASVLEGLLIAMRTMETQKG